MKRDKHSYGWWLRTVVLVLISTMVFLTLSTCDIFNENMVTYSPVEIHQADNSLFVDDIDVVNNADEISPRQTSMWIIASLMGLGLSYEKVYLLLYLIANIIAAIGCVIFVYLAKVQNKLLGVLTYSIIIGVSRLVIFGGFAVYPISALFIGMGSALGVLAMILVMYNETRVPTEIAYFAVMLAALCHIHEGIWAFAIVSVIYLYLNKRIPYRSVMFYVSTLLLLVMCLLPLLSAHGGIDADEFFRIYVVDRIPHHLLLSYEGWTGILMVVFTYCAVAYVSRDSWTEKLDARFYGFIICLFFATIAVWYSVTEIWHIPFFIKLYFVKFVKYLSVPFSLLLVQHVDRCAIEKKLLTLAIILCLLVERDVWIFMLLLAHGVDWLKLEKPWKITAWSILLAICALLFVFDSHLAKLSIERLLLCSMLFALFFNFRYREIALMVAICLGLGAYWHVKIKAKSVDQIVEHYMLDQAGESAYLIAPSIAEVVPKDAVILCDANDCGSGYVQHIARRSMYALWKTVPSSDKGIKQWYKRIEDIRDIRQWTSSDAANYMREKNLHYVLVNSEEMSDTYKEDTNFELLAENDNYQLYHLQ